VGSFKGREATWSEMGLAPFFFIYDTAIHSLGNRLGSCMPPKWIFKHKCPNRGFI